jgi:hypothetical protein
MGEVRPPSPDVLPTPRAAWFDLQHERVGLALDQLRQTQDRLQQAEARLAALTDACAGILERWTHNEERHASAVSELRGRLAEWNEIERRLLGQSTARIHQLEQRLQLEWHTVRERQEQPARQLQEQVARITDACVAGVAAAVRSCDQAEMRLEAAQQRSAEDMVAITREIREVLAEMRHGRAQLAPLTPWPLEDVRRLHGALRAEAQAPEGHDEFEGEVLGSPGLPTDARETHVPRVPHAEADDRATPLLADGARSGAAGDATAPASGRNREGTGVPTLAWPPSHTVETERRAEGTPNASSREQPVSDDGWRRSPARWAVLIAGVLVVAAVGYSSLQARSEARGAAARAATAERELAAMREQAREQLSAVQQSSDERFASMQRSAEAAQVLAGILVASDLRRFDLAPATTAGAESNAVVLLSRRQGVALNATRLAEPPSGWEYQLWLLAPGRALSAGTVRPDSGGRVSTAFDLPADLPRPILGALLTLEPSGGSTQPSGEIVFRQPRPAPPAAAVPQS